MRRFFLTGFFSVGLILVMHATSFASTASLSGSSQVNATIPGYYLNLCGLASPFASVVATVGDVLLRSTTADKDGAFYLSQIHINKTVTEICLASVDFKRIGESDACISIPEITKDTTICNIFLPPTIGISEKEVTQGQDTQIYGYTVPGATVTIRINGNESITVTADSTGFYTYTFKATKAGTFTFSATATYNDQDSLPPKRSVTLNVLSIPQKITQVTQQQVNNLEKKALETGLGFTILILILLTIIIAIIIRLNPRLIRYLIACLPKRHYPLHHDWLLEYLKKHPIPEKQTIRTLQNEKE